MQSSREKKKRNIIYENWVSMHTTAPIAIYFWTSWVVDVVCVPKTKTLSRRFVCTQKLSRFAFVHFCLLKSFSRRHFSVAKDLHSHQSQMYIICIENFKWFPSFSSQRKMWTQSKFSDLDNSQCVRVPTTFAYGKFSAAIYCHLHYAFMTPKQSQSLQ